MPTLNHEQAAALPAYQRLIASVPGAKLRGAKMAYTSLNGNMYSYLTERGTLALRFRPSTQGAVTAALGAVPCLAFGRVQKDYVEVPAARLAEPGVVEPYFRLCHDLAATLKPKPTRRP